MRTNPYNRLKEEFRSWVFKATHRQTKTMWVYPKKDLSHGWRLDTLHERVSAADQLGYDVELKATQDGLVVQYVKKIPEKPIVL